MNYKSDVHNTQHMASVKSGWSDCVYSSWQETSFFNIFQNSPHYQGKALVQTTP